MQTREQRYATGIYKQVCAIKDDPSIDVKKYGGMAHKLPILIRTAGLAQALAFVEARGKTSQQRLLKDLEQTIDVQNLAKSARETQELGRYMRLTQQTLDALLWYKRFAQSVLNVEPGEGEEDSGDD